jgi:small subunit ribosomal protein S1
VESIILDVNKENRRISLGLKQLEPNPWDVIEQNYPVGTHIIGAIRNITDFGIFVGIDEGIDGLIHISDISWSQRVKHPGELYKKGQEVEAIVLSIDRENERFSLGIKQLSDDPWTRVSARYHIGDIVNGEVIYITDFGVFVSLEDGIEGLIHISELSAKKVENPGDVVKVGQKVSAEIINIDSKERKIRLSIKSIESNEGKAEYVSYLEKQGDSKTHMADLLARAATPQAEGAEEGVEGTVQESVEEGVESASGGESEAAEVSDAETPEGD